MKQLARLSLAGLTVGVLAVAQIIPAAAQSDPLNIWYVNPLPNTPDWGRSGRIFQEGAEANGYKATMVGPNKIDIPAMISQIEQAITDGADGIITCPLDPAAFKGVIDDAKSKGIIVASIGCVDPNANFSVGTGNEQYGRVSADFVNSDVRAGARRVRDGAWRARRHGLERDQAGDAGDGGRRAGASLRQCRRPHQGRHARAPVHLPGLASVPLQAIPAAPLPRDHAAPEPTLALTKAFSALPSVECELWLGARDAEAGQHHLKEH